MQGGTETYPGTVDLVGSWREDTGIWLFLGGEATGMIVSELGCAGFSCHSRDTQKSLQGWEVSEGKKLCPSK